MDTSTYGVTPQINISFFLGIIYGPSYQRTLFILTGLLLWKCRNATLFCIWENLSIYLSSTTFLISRDPVSAEQALPKSNKSWQVSQTLILAHKLWLLSFDIQEVIKSLFLHISKSMNTNSKKILSHPRDWIDGFSALLWRLISWQSWSKFLLQISLISMSRKTPSLIYSLL